MPLFFFDVHAGNKISLDVDRTDRLKVSNAGTSRSQEPFTYACWRCDSQTAVTSVLQSMVLVRDSAGQALYTATLTFAGLTLAR